MRVCFVQRVYKTPYILWTALYTLSLPITLSFYYLTQTLNVEHVMLPCLVFKSFICIIHNIFSLGEY